MFPGLLSVNTRAKVMPVVSWGTGKWCLSVPKPQVYNLEKRLSSVSKWGGAPCCPCNRQLGEPGETERFSNTVLH